jgi:FkbM family methyltransferase
MNTYSPQIAAESPSANPRPHPGTLIRATLKDGLYRLVTTFLGDANGMVTLPVVAGPGRGLRIRADLVQRKDAYFWGKYDSQILARLTSIIQPGWTVWDCGTYIGFYTLFFARAVGPNGCVVAIEPDQRNLQWTRDNVKLNGFANVRFVNAAIGAPLGEVDFLLDDKTNSHLPGCYAGGCDMKTVWNLRDRECAKTRVLCMSLDQALYVKNLPAPNLIKIDIEGAEKDALPYLERLAADVRPQIVLELHNPECDRAAWNFAKRAGYRLWSMNTGEELTDEDKVHGTLLCASADEASSSKKLVGSQETRY